MGVPIWGLLGPTDPTDTYAVTDPLTGIDGMRSVANAAARNAIGTPRRRLGMLVALQSDLTVWQLNTATNTGTNADWTAFGTGGGGGSGSRTFAWALGLNSDVVVSVNQSPIVICNAGGTFSRWDLFGEVPPVGASLVLDFLISTDSGATFTSLWHTTPSNRPTLATTVAQATGTAFDITTFAAGNLIRQDTIQIGSSTAGSGVSVAILGSLT